MNIKILFLFSFFCFSHFRTFILVSCQGNISKFRFFKIGNLIIYGM